MAVDANKVRIGTPDQLTTGAILCAPLGTAVPTLDSITPAAVKLDPAFKDAGYASSDGVTMTPDYSTNDITEWGGSMVRRVLETFTGEISFTLIQTDDMSFKMALGDEHVEAMDATNKHGNQVSAKFGAHLPEAKAWVFKMKDGAARMLIVVPNGQVTSLDEVTFNSTDPVGWAVTVSCYPDADGESIYVLTDDGQLSASSAHVGKGE